MILETTLFLKTIIILTAQLGLSVASCFYCLKSARKAYENNTTFLGSSFRGAVNMKNELDLIPYTKVPKIFPAKMNLINEKLHPKKTRVIWANNRQELIGYLKEGYQHEGDSTGTFSLFGVFFVWFLSLGACTFFATSGLSIFAGLSLFTISSLTFGPLLAFIMLEMDENDGFRALKITLLVTLITGFIGYSDIYSFSESLFLALFLIGSLLGLIIFEFVRIFRGFSRWAIRIKAIFGAFLFSIFLLFDFNLLRKKGDIAEFNNWETAYEMAFTIYLDVINLLLEILDAMGI